MIEGDTVVICEAKFLDFSASGRTATARRTKHRKKVIDQCRVYCAWARLQFANKKIVGYVATNEHSSPQKVVQDMPHAEAINIVVRSLEALQQRHVLMNILAYLRSRA